jgi:hypothetical protein
MKTQWLWDSTSQKAVFQVTHEDGTVEIIAKWSERDMQMMGFKTVG